MPAIPDLPPRACACAEQWTEASYETHGEAFICYWRARRGMYSDWVGVWANRIVAIHSQVMRDQKFGNAPIDVGNYSKIYKPGERESLAALTEARAGLTLAEFEQLRNEHFRKFGGSRDPPERRGGVVELGRLPSVRRATG